MIEQPMAVPRFREIKNYLIAGGALAIVVGFADLVRGGITVSALLLATAYCVLIPLAIWSDGQPEKRPSKQPPYGAAAIVGALVLALYLVTMAPSTAMWDTSEYIAAAYTFGLPHPPGNPFFVIIGRVFAILPIAGTVAARVNVLAAVCSAVAAGVWFLVADHVLRGWIESRWVRLTGAALAATIGATAFTVWNQSVVNEKVYTVSLVGIALVSWLLVRWSAEPADARADQRLVMAAYLCGLGYANHMAGMLPAVAIAVAIVVRRPATLVRWRLVASCLFVLVVGLTPFATQPVRAAYFPAMNEGETTGCRTSINLSCTFSKSTYDAFMYNFNRNQYGKPALSDRQASLGEQVGMWWLYFKWQWLRDAYEGNPFTQSLLAATFLVLGLFGAWVHFTRDRSSFWYFGTLMFTMTLLLIYYLNFKLGASQDPASQSPHEVRDRDYFFLWSYSAWGVWAALGLTYVWESLAALLTREEAPGSRGWILASPVALLAFVPLVGNWSSASRARHHTTADMAADLLNSVEPYGVLITRGDNDTFPLWYAQEVEGIRRDVVVVCTSLLGTDWYARQIIRRPIYDYDAASGPSAYRDTKWVKPTTPPLHMSFADADAVPDYYDVRQPFSFDAGDLHTIVDPKRLEYGVLVRADALVLRMIRDAWPERPIYFARSDIGYPRSLGLEQFVLTQGLASKVFVPPASPSARRDTVFVEGDGWLDVARSRALWNSFRAPRSIISEGQWIDRPSANIAGLYLFAGSELAEVSRSEHDMAKANEIMSTVRQVAHATRLDNFVSSAESVFASPASGDSSSAIPLRVDAGSQPKVQSSDPAAKKRK
jgi:Protein of unknown function (DUF2723)